MSKEDKRIEAAIAALRAGNIDEAIRIGRGGVPVQARNIKKPAASVKRPAQRRAA
jgi:hypothetical protein